MHNTKIKLGVVGDLDNIHFKRRFEKIDKEKYDITVICRADFPINYYINVPVFSVNLNSFRFLKHFQSFFQYFCFIKKQKFDIIYCFGGDSAVAWLASIAADRYFVVTTLGVDVLLDDQINMSAVIKRNIKETLRAADLVTTLTAYMETRLLEHFKIPPKKIIQDFLDIEEAWYTKKKSTSTQEIFYPIILSPRMLNILYQQEKIFRSLPLIKKRFQKVLLVQTTFGKNEEYFLKCQSLIRLLDIEENVLFLENFQKPEMLIDSFDQSDIVVMVPKSDGMPSSMIEAWSRNKPVIVSNIANYDEFYNRKLFLKTDITENFLADAVFEIIENDYLRNQLIEQPTQFLKDKRKIFKKSDIFESYKMFKKKNLLSKLWRFLLFMLFLIEPWFKFPDKNSG